MAGNVRKPLEFILVFTVHMVLNGPGQAEPAEEAKVINGVIDKNITLQFDLNAKITNNSRFAVYIKGEKKISEHPNFQNCFEILHNNSVLYHITNLTQNNSDVYWLTLFPDQSNIGITHSNKVKLIVHKYDSSTTVPPKTTSHISSDSGSSSVFSPDAVTFLVVTSVVLVTAILSFLICFLVKTKDQEIDPHKNSNPTMQETISSVEFSMNVPGPSLVYSVLDFPKRPPAVVEFNPSDTEYASVSYIPEKRTV